MKRDKLFILLLALFLSFSLTAWAKEDNRQKLYDGAVALMDMEYYEEARAVLNVLGDYSDSQTLLAECEQKIGGTEQAEETGAYTLTVTVQVKLLQANHVGNEWVPAFYVNGQYTAWSSSNEKKSNMPWKVKRSVYLWGIRYLSSASLWKQINIRIRVPIGSM